MGFLAAASVTIAAFLPELRGHKREIDLFFILAIALALRLIQQPFAKTNSLQL
jgi:hypothetical protein